MREIIEALGARNLIGFCLGLCVAGAVVCVLLVLKRESEHDGGSTGAGSSFIVQWTPGAAQTTVKVISAGGGGPDH